jgi:hypothetical protein
MKTLTKYLAAVLLLCASSCGIEMAQAQSARDRALDRMERQHEGLQQLQMELWLYRGGDWYMNDPVYNPRNPVLEQQFYEYRRNELERRRQRDDDDTYCDMTVRNVC